MKSTRAADHWRHVCDSSRPRSLRLRSLQLEAITGIGSAKIPLHPVISVICGANGVGKSTMLNVCSLTLDYSGSEAKLKARYATASTVLELEIPGSGSTTCSFALSAGQHSRPAGTTIEIHRIDPGADWYRLQKFILAESNWDELLEQYSPRPLSQDELDRLSFLVGKHYTSGMLYEIEDFDNGDTVFPYPIIEADGQSYRFEEMGTGEGSLFLLWWRLQHVKNCAIVLLEEPECHITSRSQRALMDSIAEICSKRVSCIVTTHSADIIEHVPRECLRLLVRRPSSVKIIDQPDQTYFLQALGVELSCNLVALLEDSVGCVLARELLRAFRPELVGSVHFAIAGDSSKVLTVAKLFPVGTPCPKLIGILDGDQRSSGVPVESGNPAGANHPIDYLPSDLPPEDFLRNACRHQDDAIAFELSTSSDKVSVALSAVEGSNHHDWLPDLARHLDISLDRLVPALIRIALKDPETYQVCKLFAESLATHVFSAAEA